MSLKKFMPQPAESKADMQRVIMLAAVLLLAGCAKKDAVKEMWLPANVEVCVRKNILPLTGEDFFTRHFIFDDAKTVTANGLTTAVFWYRHKGYAFINEEVRFVTDSSGVLIGATRIEGVPNCVAGGCTYAVTEEQARATARVKGLKPGTKPWGIEFTWSPKHGKYVWQVRSVLAEGEGSNGYRGNGELLLIDPANGGVLERSEWRVQ